MIKLNSIYQRKCMKYTVVPFRKKKILLRLLSSLRSFSMCISTYLRSCVKWLCVWCKTCFVNLIILVNREETNPKIVDSWYSDVGLMDIQLLDTLKCYSKPLTLPVNTCYQCYLGSCFWSRCGGFSIPGPRPKEHHVLSTGFWLFKWLRIQERYKDEGELNEPLSCDL